MTTPTPDRNRDRWSLLTDEMLMDIADGLVWCGDTEVPLERDGKTLRAWFLAQGYGVEVAFPRAWPAVPDRCYDAVKFLINASNAGRRGNTDDKFGVRVHARWVIHESAHNSDLLPAMMAVMGDESIDALRSLLDELAREPNMVDVLAAWKRGELW